MDKRKMIERALGSFVSRGWREEMALKGWEFYKDDFLNALAEQAIVEKNIHIKHITYPNGAKRTIVTYKPGRQHYTLFEQFGHHGTPGKAIAIIVPLEKEDE